MNLDQRVESPDASKRLAGMQRPRFNQNLEVQNNIQLNAYGQDNFNAHQGLNKSIGAYGRRGFDAPRETAIRGGIPSVPDFADDH